MALRSGFPDQYGKKALPRLRKKKKKTKKTSTKKKRTSYKMARKGVKKKGY